jgi:hypothetical protein
MKAMKHPRIASRNVLRNLNMNNLHSKNPLKRKEQYTRIQLPRKKRDQRSRKP